MNTTLDCRVAESDTARETEINKTVVMFFGMEMLLRHNYIKAIFYYRTEFR